MLSTIKFRRFNGKHQALFPFPTFFLYLAQFFTHHLIIIPHSFPTRAPHSTLDSIWKMRQKGFIITIQSNSTRTEVASTWRQRRHTMVQRVACCWRELSSGMAGITHACPTVLFQLRDMFTFWMVRWEREKTFFLFAKMCSNLMTFNTIFLPHSVYKTKIRQRNIRARRRLASLTASFRAQLCCFCSIIAERGPFSSS